MIRFRVTGTTKPFKLGWWKPTRAEWVPVLLDDHPQFWKKQVDPTTGRPWDGLSPRYNAWKQKHAPGQPTLRLSGLMQDASFIFTRGNQFLVKSTPYGAYNQYGTSKMPARPWMGVPDISLKQIVPIAWKHILTKK